MIEFGVINQPSQSHKYYNTFISQLRIFHLLQLATIGLRLHIAWWSEASHWTTKWGETLSCLPNSQLQDLHIVFQACKQSNSGSPSFGASNSSWVGGHQGPKSIKGTTTPCYKILSYESLIFVDSERKKKSSYLDIIWEFHGHSDDQRIKTFPNKVIKL